MPRRELLSPIQRAAILALPEDEGELIRRYPFTTRDMALVQQRRGDSNRFGFAVHLCHLRFPGQILGAGESPDPRLTRLVARQLGLDSEVWSEYAQRDQTRREHLQLIIDAYGYRQFSAASYRELALWLLPLAMQSDQGMVLAQTVLEELRIRKIIVPPISVVERLCAETASRALCQIHQALTDPLSQAQQKKLDTLFQLKESTTISVLAWLRQPVAATGPRHLMDLIERLRRIRDLGLPPELANAVHQNRLLKLARTAEQSTSQHLRRFDDDQRHALLVALLLETRATLTDECLAMHDRIMGALFARAKRRHLEVFADSAQTINEKVRLFAKVGHALVEARKNGVDPFTAIETVMPWEAFEASVTEAASIAKPGADDSLGLIGTSYSQIRRYAPALLETFEFKAAPVAEDLLEAIYLLRRLNATGTREIPEGAPSRFIRKRWASLVHGEGGIERRFYELCVLSEMKNSLRSGDLWVSGSRQFKDFEEYLLSPHAFNELKAGGLPLPVEPDGERYLEKRLDLLREELAKVNALADQGALPDATFSKGVLRVTPLTNLVPEEAATTMRKVYDLMPHIRVTELLLEVDRWTNFSRHFTHLKSGKPPSDPTLLLTAVLADVINIGLSKMAEACPDANYAKLSWLGSSQKTEKIVR